ncbi:MAG: hypothetical protein V7708_02870 [Oceanicoccus sp.]
MDKKYLQVEISKDVLATLIGSGHLVVEDLHALNIVSKECLRSTVLLSVVSEITS